MVAVLLLAKAEIEAEYFASVFRRFTRAGANGFDNFGFRRAAFHTLFAGMFGETNRLHGLNNYIFPQDSAILDKI